MQNNSPTRKSDLFLHYPQTIFPTPCGIQLDCENGELSYFVAGERTSPQRIFNHIVLRWDISKVAERTTVKDVKRLMEEIAPLAEKVCEGFDTRWNGKNFVGVFDKKAKKAKEEIDLLTYRFCDYVEDCHAVRACFGH